MAEGNVGDTPATGIALIGAALLGVVGLHLGLEHLPAMQAATDPVILGLQLVELVVMVLFPLALVLAGRWLAANAVDQGYNVEHQWTMTTWTAFGVLTIAAMIGAIKIHQLVSGAPIDWDVARMEILSGAGIGGVLGLLVGVNVARARLQTSRLREQRDAFAFLNRALRHHVLNGTNVIEGYAGEIRERLDPMDRELVDPIEHRSQTITDLVHSVAAIVDTFTGPSEAHPVDFVDLVAEEVAEARLAYPNVNFEVDLGGVLYVEGNEKLQLVVMNLLANAAEHNDSDQPTVAVSIRREPESAILEVADNGPGLGPQAREAAFEPGTTGDDGFGLYLADQIVEEHGGSVAIRDNRPRGTVVTVALPRTEPPDRSAAGEAAGLSAERSETLRRFSRTDSHAEDDAYS